MGAAQHMRFPRSVSPPWSPCCLVTALGLSRVHRLMPTPCSQHTSHDRVHSRGAHPLTVQLASEMPSRCHEVSWYPPTYPHPSLSPLSWLGTGVAMVPHFPSPLKHLLPEPIGNRLPGGCQRTPWFCPVELPWPHLVGTDSTGLERRGPPGMLSH